MAKIEFHNLEVIAFTNNVSFVILDSYKTKFQKVTVELSRNITMFVVEQLKNLDCNTQKIVIENFLIHPLVKNMLPNYLANIHCVKTNERVISNLKTKMIDHLVGNKKSQIVVARDIVYTLAFS